ncbi:MAG: T9SS type A sorting domain-containing protein, partial [Ignavibacteriaceae bacterium]
TITNSTITSIQNTNAVLRIGAWVQSYLNSFTGSIDDIRIYNRVLTNGEIQILYGSLVDVKNDENIVSNDYYINQNYPNPFNPSTKISWHSTISAQQSLKIFDILGNEVANLVDEFRSAGDYEIRFDSKGLTSGVYFYQIQIGDFVQTKKMILLK